VTTDFVTTDFVTTDFVTTDFVTTSKNDEKALLAVFQATQCRDYTWEVRSKVNFEKLLKFKFLIFPYFGMLRYLWFHNRGFANHFSWFLLLSYTRCEVLNPEFFISSFVESYF